MRRTNGRPPSAGNLLPAALPADERERLPPRLGPEHLRSGRTLLAPRDRVRHAYFPTDGVLSMLIVMGVGTPVEAVTVGREGFVSVGSLPTSDRGRSRCVARPTWRRCGSTRRSCGRRSARASRCGACSSATRRSSSVPSAARSPAR